MQQQIDVHIYMEKGMYGRLIDRAQETGVPLSAVVREAIAQYFERIPETPERTAAASPEDPIWQIPSLHESYGALSLPVSGGQGGS